MNSMNFISNTSPSQFAERELKLQLYSWQTEVLEWYLHTNKRVLGALVTPNGAGKSSNVVAALALWWASIHPRGTVVITSKDSKQLEQQIHPALNRHRGKVKSWKWVSSPYIEITTCSGGRIIAFTTNDAGRAEGWHKEDNRQGPLLMIVDEAKSVEEPIFQALDRCTYNALLYVSSPGLMAGTFWDAFTKNAALFQRRRVSLLECPHIPRERVEGMIAKYGVKHPLVQSSVYGEFMDQDAVTAFVFSLSQVQANLQQPPRRAGGSRSAFCDFAGGGDENVLAIREGNQVTLAAKWRERDTMASVGRFIIEFRKAGLRPAEIFADEGGLGKPMIDALWAAGWEVNRVNNCGRPHDPLYDDRGAEMWHETAAAVMRGEIILPQDDDLVAQLTTRRCRVTSDGKLGLEPKKEMSSRGLSSPDRADAVCGAWSCRPLTLATRHPFFDDGGDNPDFSNEAMAGMQAG